MTDSQSESTAGTITSASDVTENISSVRKNHNVKPGNDNSDISSIDTDISEHSITTVTVSEMGSGDTGTSQSITESSDHVPRSRPVPKPRKISKQYSDDFEASYSRQYSDDFETPSPVPRQYSDDFEATYSRQYSDDFETSISRQYSDDFETVTPSRQYSNDFEQPTEVGYSDDFEPTTRVNYSSDFEATMTSRTGRLLASHKSYSMSFESDESASSGSSSITRSR